MQFRAKCWPSLPTITAAASDALRPRPRLSLPAWVPSQLRLPGEMSADPGAIRIDGSMAYMLGILQAADDVDTREITIVASSQIGKTTALLAIMLGLSLISPAPAMFVTPDRDSLRELIERIYAICEGSARDVARRLLPSHLRNDLWIDLQVARIHLAFSGNKQRLSSKPCCRVLMTEVDRYDLKKSSEGDTMSLAEERVKMFSNSLIVRESTPTIQGKSRICAALDQSDRRLFEIPCWHCNRFQPLYFFPRRSGEFAGRGGIKGLKDGRGNWASPEEAFHAAYYECVYCQGRIEDRHKTAAVEQGLWVPRGCRVERGQIVGEPERPPRHAGFQLSTLYAPADRIPLGKIAEVYLQARDKPKKMQNFVNNWLGMAYEEKVRRAKWEDLRDRLTTAIPRGECHPEAVFLTAGADVQAQANGVYYVVRAWWVRKDQCTSCLVEAGRVLPRLSLTGDPEAGSDLQQLDELVLNREFPIFGSTAKLTVRMLAIDTGHRTHEVYRWVRARPGGRVRGIKGDGHKMAATWRRALVDYSPVDGSPITGGQELWHLDVGHFKEDIQDRWSTPPDAPGAWLLSKPVSEAYLRQITNEAPSAKPGRHGVTTAWAPIDDGTGVDLWDCEVYARAASEMIVGLNLWHTLPQLVAAAESRPPAGGKPKPKPPAGPRVERPGGWTAR